MEHCQFAAELKLPVVVCSHPDLPHGEHPTLGICVTCKRRTGDATGIKNDTLRTSDEMARLLGVCESCTQFRGLGSAGAVKIPVIYVQCAACKHCGPKTISLHLRAVKCPEKKW